MINICCGCQSVLEVNDSNGIKINSSGFSGMNPIYYASNLLVYYYE